MGERARGRGKAGRGCRSGQVSWLMDDGREGGFHAWGRRSALGSGYGCGELDTRSVNNVGAEMQRSYRKAFTPPSCRQLLFASNPDTVAEKPLPFSSLLFSLLLSP